jgi:glutamate 5-kinase
MFNDKQNLSQKRKNLEMKKKIVIKIGSSTLTAGTNRISFGKIEDLARQITQLREKYQIIIVSSGAIATARQVIDLHNSQNINNKQALAAIGQPRLMRIYDGVFENFGLQVAQCLLTYHDFEKEATIENTKNTLFTLLEHGIIPIINENDTVSAEEIIFGDNDKLSAMVAKIIDADILFLASDIDGIFDKNPHLHSDAQLIKKVSDLKDIEQFIEEKPSKLGTGGMTSKIKAAEICFANNIEMYIVNGTENHFIENALNGTVPCTHFKKNDN